ncbi:unnamed protein product, partial [Urochloa humidicola]
GVRRSRRAVAHRAPRLLLADVQRWCRGAHGRRRCRRRRRALAAAPAADEEAVAGTQASAHPLEAHDVAGVEALLLHVPAPALGEHVALAAGPVRIPEPPRLAGLVLEGQQQALLAAIAAADPTGATKGEVPLRVLLGDHQPVELADVAGRERLLEQDAAALFPFKPSVQDDLPRPGPDPALLGVLNMVSRRSRHAWGQSDWPSPSPRPCCLLLVFGSMALFCCC